MKKVTTTVIAAALAFGTIASAKDNSAYTNTALNMRIGPNTSYDVVTVLPANAQLDVYDCIDSTNWCTVSYGIFHGWVSENYLSFNAEKISAPKRKFSLFDVLFKAQPNNNRQTVQAMNSRRSDDRANALPAQTAAQRVAAVSAQRNNDTDRARNTPQANRTNQDQAAPAATPERRPSSGGTKNRVLTSASKDQPKTTRDKSMTKKKPNSTKSTSPAPSSVSAITKTSQTVALKSNVGSLKVNKDAFSSIKAPGCIGSIGC